VAESIDGVHFELITLQESGVNTPAGVRRTIEMRPSASPSPSAMTRPKDGNAVLHDDDGTGYIAFTNLDPGGGRNHMVYIEKLTPDLRHAANESVCVHFLSQPHVCTCQMGRIAHLCARTRLGTSARKHTC
jgi:hypothetical protein